MSDNSSNTSNTRKRTSPVTIALALFEAFVLAEILWYYLHDEDQTLHGAMLEYAERVRTRAASRVAVDETRAMIRNLPETSEQ